MELLRRLLGFKAFIALAVAAGLALLFSVGMPVAGQAQIDYDINDNGLIEIGSLA